MIIDSHAHAFPSMGSSSGHRGTQEHMRWVQHSMRHHHQPVRRVDDNSIFREQTLYDGKDLTLNGLTKVNYRGGNTENSSGQWTGPTTRNSTSRLR